MALIDQLIGRPDQKIIMSYAPSGGTQKQFYNSWNVCNVIRGPVGSAKTTAMVFKVWDSICDQAKSPDGVRRSRVAICRNTNMDLKRTILEEWLNVVPDSCGIYNRSEKTHHLRFRLHEDGSFVESTIYFMALDTEKSVRALLSMQLTIIVFNEIREHNFLTISRGLQRVARYPPQRSMPVRPVGDPKYLRYWDPKRKLNPRYWSGLIADSNAWDRDHWLEFLRRKNSPRWSYFDQPPGVIKQGGVWVPNPEAENIQNLSPTYYEDAVDSAKESDIRVQLANEMTVTVNGEAVHPDFDHNLNVCSTADYIPGLPVYAGFDFARRPAAVFIQPFNTGYQVFAEFPMFNVGLRRFFTELTTFLMVNFRLQPGDLYAVGDESGNQRNESDERAFDIASECGFTISESPIGNKDHHGRRDSIDRHLKGMRPDGKSTFLVHPDCRYLIGGLEGKWFYQKVNTLQEDRFATQPVKNDYSHTCEACEYGMSQFGAGYQPQSYQWRAPPPAYS